MPHPVTALAKEIRAIRTSFRQLARAFGRIAPILTAVPKHDGTSAESGRHHRRKPRLTTAYRRMLKLQGKYMGTMGGLPPRQKA